MAALGGAALAQVILIPNVASLKLSAPKRTAIMLQRMREHEQRGQPYRIQQQPVPLSQISKNLRWAVIVSEDGAFYGHAGIDLDEIRASIQRDLEEKRVARGGSTITMQLARNLYLSTSKNPLRKLREIAIARAMEAELSKGRILELYLNSVEWGEGIFGCEAAARAYFGVSCADLGPEQAALMAAVLPNPLRRNVLSPSKSVLWKQRWILAAMRKRGVLDSGAPGSPGGMSE
ncbi:MAG: monofunctional biosynthetic peptidoglycan transglycosylase [Candidatus Tectomicrobia bacterium]|uniref:Monofunctional biosynthetic peptidoglycan transglycosylase n=1 Tax=Tectimicrobiota bacterium TaxID=2528274 RepID=A0A932M1L8_UNCTE|nr:monofunctional biosynthetic peptidoglycan transglycosylase [Candidatus Tectomicrobia bacterium]